MGRLILISLASQQSGSLPSLRPMNCVIEIRPLVRGLLLRWRGKGRNEANFISRRLLRQSGAVSTRRRDIRSADARHDSLGSKCEELRLSITSPLDSPTADIGADIAFRRFGPEPDSPLENTR